MISLRVNEILKYLSIDKKEQLKRCVQGMERSDNVRILKNNIPNADPSSSLSSSSSGVSLVLESEEEVEESMPDAQLRVRSRESTAVAATPNERAEEKLGGEFKSKKFSKDFNKRRPLMLLKGENIQRVHPRSPSISENSFSFPESNCQNIPKESQLPHVEPNGVKPLVLSKSKVQRNSKTSDSTHKLPLKSKLDKKSENNISDLTKGCLKSTGKQKLSKQKNTKQKHEIQHLETGSGLKVNGAGKNVEGPDPVLCPAVPSPSFRTNRKQNGNKDPICGKTQRGPKSEGQESVENGPRGSAKNLPGVGRRRFPKARAGKDSESGCLEMTGLGLKTKENGLDQMKVDLPKLNGYKSSSGVAELDTFEITSLKKMLQKKQYPDVLTSDALNELDTFDDPVVMAVHRPLNESLVFPATPEMAEKWIEVNRKVKRIVVPSKAVGRILGSDGSKLEAICSVSKAHIEQETTGTAKETVFTIKGTLEQMQAACNMILALTKDCDSKISHRNGGSLPTKSGLPSDIALQNTSDKQLETLNSKLQHLPAANNIGVAARNKITPYATQGIVIQQQEEGFQESGKLGKSGGLSHSERCSPDKDPLMGEYSLFEHGVGQPLEKLLACKDLTRQTFAHAAGSRCSGRPLAAAVPNRWCTVDRRLLAKAPGYRDIGNRELCPLNFPPSQPLPHSTVSATLSAEPSSLSGNPTAIHAFSKLNPNAPDFVFASPPGVVDLNHPSGSCPNGLHVEPADTSVGVTSEETAYQLSIENGINPLWFHSQESWNKPKISFGVVGALQSVDAYPSQNEVHNSYFAHPTLRTNAALPYSALFYQQQQQNMMLAPIKVNHQTLAQAGP